MKKKYFKIKHPLMILNEKKATLNKLKIKGIFLNFIKN
jgi:hypothetical protein